MADAPQPLSLSLRPVRIGLNMLTATAECDITVAAPAEVEEVSVAIRLLAATIDEGQAIAALHAEPLGKPIGAPFRLAAGEQRTLRGIGVLPREAAGGLEAAGRPLFVPLVAVAATWRDAGGTHRATRAFAVGVERVDSAKLAPIWLDQPARAYEQVAARAHGEALIS